MNPGKSSFQGGSKISIWGMGRLGIVGRLSFFTSVVCLLLSSQTSLKAQGNSCANATVIDAGDCSGSFSLDNTFTDTRCSNNRAAWFRFTPSTSGIYTLTANGPSGRNPVIFVHTSCSAGGTCHNGSAGTTETATVSLLVGTTYFINVEINGDGTFSDFCVSDPCIPSGVSITCPSNTTVECAINVPAPNPGSIVFSSNCGGSVVHVSDVIRDQSCRDRYYIDRTYSVRIAGTDYASCVQVIRVHDSIAPSIICPRDVSVTCDEDIPPVNVAQVLSGDHCANTGVVNSFVSDIISNQTCMNRYTLTRTYAATDTCGNVRQCNQVITVNDTQLPTARCQDLLVYLESNGAFTIDPSQLDNGSTDNCTAAIPVLFDASKTTFRCNDIGLNQVTLIVYDECRNSSTCVSTVEVRDTFNSVVVCRDLEIYLGPGECQAVLDYKPDITAALCDQEPYINTLDSNTYQIGGFIPIGTHNICYVVIDEGGGINTCCSEIKVIEFQNPIRELACRGGIQISLDENCEATITAEWILTGGPYGCWDSYEVKVQLWNGGPFIDRDPIKPGTQIDRREIGKELKITVTDPRTGNSCWGKATVEDKLAPTISCPNHTTLSCEMEPLPKITGIPDVQENCGGFTLDYMDEITRGSCFQNYQALIKRTWKATDDFGKTSTCIQFITILNGNLDNISLPSDFDDSDKQSLLCDERIDRNKNITPHLSSSPQCVDGYLLDSAYWLSNPGLPDIYGERRLPRILGWNDISDPGNPNFGHPNPDPVFYPAHPAWSSARAACWAPNTHIMWLGTGRPGSTGCHNIATAYEDLIFDITSGACDPGTSGCYKILRRWTMIDWCSGEVRTHDQIIKILDKKGPQVIYPNTLNVSMDPWVCSGRWDVAVPWLTDNCSNKIDYTVEVEQGTVLGNSQTGFVVVDIPEGWHNAWIIAYDCCGNETRHQIELHVYDFTPPQAICQTKTVVTLIPTPDKGGSVTKIFVKSFDDGSFDNCAEEVFFKAIRMEELLGTLNGSTADNTVSCSGANGDDDLNVNGNQVYFDDHVKFCCGDLGKNVMVVFRVFDVYPGDGPVHPSRLLAGGDLYGRYSDCMVEVEVQDKATPVLVPPSDVVVSCDFWFDINELDKIDNQIFGTVSPDLEWRKEIKTKDKVCVAYCEPNPLTGYPGARPGTVGKLACDLFGKYYQDAHPDSTYSLDWGLDGYILSACGSTVSITVVDQRECGQGLIRRIFSVNGPNGTVVSGTQNIWVVNCDPFYVDYQFCNDTTRSDVVWPYGICENKPVELKGCGSDISPDNPLLGRPRIVNRGKDHCSLIVITYKDDIYSIETDACYKVLRKWVVIDWCQYDPNVNPNKGRWERVQVIVVHDLTAPEVTCQSGPCELAEKNSQSGLCEAHITLTASASDLCSPPDWLSWEYKIDLYNDGVGSYGGYDYRVGNLTRLQYLAGEKAAFRDNPGADFPGNPFDASGIYPIGTHRITWFVGDGCGNIGTCTKIFEIRDCKAPTPVCHTAIITVPMPSTGCIDIWASDLNVASFDNCTPSDKLKFYFNGDSSKPAITVCCKDFVDAKINDELVIEVEMWVEDEAGNRDYCKSLIVIQDNLNTCPNVGSSKGRISGLIRTSEGKEASPVEISLYNNGQMLRQMNGSPYAFSDLAMFTTYQIKPVRKDDPLNGVSTQDIVKIQKHILGLQQIDDPYRLLAADVNRSSSITAADISEIRKLILGIQAEFNKSDSWSFVPSAHRFENPAVPFGAPDHAEITLSQQQLLLDFITIKTGDVTGDALARTLSGQTPRSRSELNLYAVRLTSEKEEIQKIAFRSPNFRDITGMQFTLQFDPSAMEFDGVESSLLSLSSSHLGLQAVEQGIITLSWDSPDLIHGLTASPETDLFVIKFRSAQKTKEISGIKILNHPTRAEAYDSREGKYGISLSNFGLPSNGFELFQNEPNPFATSTEVRFHLPQDGPVKLSCYDVLGKLIRIWEIDGLKGMNSLTISRDELNGLTGVLYVQLDAGAHSATRKMVLSAQ